MTTPRRFEHDLPALLADLYVAGTPDYRDDLVERIAATRQRPAWTFPERWLPMDITVERVRAPRTPWLRAIAVLALIAALLVAMLATYIGSQPRLPSPFGIAATGQLIYSQAGDIFVRDTLDGEARLLVGGPDEDHIVAYSPLGSKILIARVSGNAVDLVTTKPDGSDLATIGGPFVDATRIEWSPDESTVAIAHLVDGEETISLVPTDGSGARVLEVGMAADSPTWRPSGDGQLAFRGKGDGAWGLYLVQPDGTGLVQMDVPRDKIEDPYEVLEPAWSPAGDRIAFHRLVLTPGEGNGNGFRITIADVSPTGTVVAPTTLTFVNGSDDEHVATWTPAGDGLIFLRRDGEIDSVALVTLADMNAREFDVTAVGAYGGIAYTLTPDGRRLVAHKWNGNTDWLVDVETGGVTQWGVGSDDGVAFQRIAP